MGFSDLGCFGGEIDTPNLDALAGNGFRATQFYNTARCCPARASLLTGLYPHQAGVGLMVYRDYGEGYEGGLNDQCVTFAEVLRESGYQTMLSGKWHAGHECHSRPEVRGFDRFTGIYTHVDSYWKVLSGCDIYRDGELFIEAGENPINPYNPDQEFYTTDFFTDTAIDYINQAGEVPDKPFLLHLCYNTPHFPLEAPDELIEKYRGRYMQGWDVLRSEKLERMKSMGIVGKNQSLPRAQGFDSEDREGYDYRPSFDTDHLPEWKSLSLEVREQLDFRRAIYAAQIERLDQNIGRLVNHLKESDLLDNTLILFMSDNGCSGEMGEFGCNWPEKGRGNYREWRKEGGWATSQGQCWASLSNTPLRKYKIFVHEGGIASPFIAHWPNGIKAPGEICFEQVFHLIDIMPTLCEVAGTTYPDIFAGKRITTRQGMSMLPYLVNDSAAPVERTIYWQHELNAAIRAGNWKLVTSDDRDEAAWELYDLTGDRSETEDLRAGNPEVADRLKKQWQVWASDTHVIPWPEERGNLRRIPWPPE
jgi:arylsulfatase